MLATNARKIRTENGNRKATSTIYKQYQAGFYGLATAGNVILFIAVTLLVYPLMRFFSKRELEL